MAEENKTENTDDITMDVMPGADPVPEEEAGKDFKVDMNFEEEVEFPKEEEVEEVEELKADEESQEGTEEVEEEEEAEAVVEEAESGGEEGVLEADDGDTQQPEGEVETRADEETSKEPMIPKSRLDEVLAKQRALQKKLEEATNPQEVIDEAPTYDFDAKEIEYQNFILNGRTDDAAKLRAEIREAERKSMMFEVQTKMGQTVQQSTEVVALQKKAEELATKYSVLDETHADFNKEVTQEVLDLRDAFITQGFTGADALDKAAKYVMGPYKEPEPQTSTVDKKVVEKKKVANTKKKIEAAESQPPDLKGKNKVEKKVNINNMSVDEFDALPAETLKRMRGDFG